MTEQSRKKLNRNTKWGTFWAFLGCLTILWFHLTYSILSSHYSQIISTTALDRANTISTELIQPEITGSSERRKEVLSSLEMMDDVVAINVLDADTGSSLLSYSGDNISLPTGFAVLAQKPFRLATEKAAPVSRSFTSKHQDTGNNRELTRLVLPVSEGKKVVQFIDIVLDQSKLKSTVSHYMRRAIFDFSLQIIFILLIFMMGFWHMKRASIRKIRLAAQTDKLTDLPNRRAFTDNLHSLVDHDDEYKPHALISLDINRFRDINTRVGSQNGDQILVILSRRIAAYCLSNAALNSVIARLEGDCFGILVEGLGEIEETSSFISGLITELSDPITIAGHKVELNIRAGICLFPRDTDDPSVLMSRAELAHQMAKKDIMGGFRFHDNASEEKYEQQRSIERVVADACESEDAVKVHYQPLVNLENNRIIGFEALARPTGINGVPIDAETFVEIAERTGAIEKLGRRVLNHACATAMRWPDPLNVAVNLSPIQFDGGGLIDTVTSALEKSGLPAKRLELEVTEGLLLQDSTAVLQQLNALKELGIKIVLDDFGAGYSSLNYLWQFPFDKIKIDRSIVEAMVDNTKARDIVVAVISLAGSMKVPVTAEGVETRAQYELLAELGCQFAQGFLIGRAIPDMDVAALLIRNFEELQLQPKKTENTNYLETVSNVLQAPAAS